MNKLKKIFLTIVLLALVFSQSGCALLTAPVSLLGTTIQTVGKIIVSAIDLVGKLPKPPPGVF